jgi:hypothetical protein
MTSTASRHLTNMLAAASLLTMLLDTSTLNTNVVSKQGFEKFGFDQGVLIQESPTLAQRAI